MANCSKCGSYIDDNAKFCNICGQAVATMPAANTNATQNYSAPNYAQPTYTQPNYNQQAYGGQNYASRVPQSPLNDSNIPPEYKPISAWGYFGYNLLFAIPIIGFIFLIVYACGGTQNKNLKNYARSFFCGFIVALIIGIIFGVLAIVFGFNMSNYNFNY